MRLGGSASCGRAFVLWERRYGRSLSDEEKREIGLRLTGFFKTLMRVDLKQQKEQLQKKIIDVEKMMEASPYET